MSSKLSKILHFLSLILNNSWVVGISISILIIPKLPISKVFNFLSPLISFFSVNYIPLVHIVSIILLFGIVIHFYRSWPLVRWPDQSRILSFDPILKLVNLMRRKSFNMQDLELICSRFQNKDGNPYYSIRKGIGSSYVNQNWRAGEKPIIVLKIPARDHMSLPDFQDLRLLRHIVSAGGSVIVIILDVPYGFKEVNKIDMDKCSDKTHVMIRSILGSSVTIRKLSAIFANKHGQFLRFLFDTYIPAYASKLRNKTTPITQSIQDDATAYSISFFSFALFLASIDFMKKHGQTFMPIQWDKRLSKWEFFPGLIEPYLISGLLLGDTFYDADGNKLPAFTTDCGNRAFTMTESDWSIAKKLLLLVDSDGDMKWRMPEKFVNYIAKNVFGIDINSTPVSSHSLPIGVRKRIKKFYKRFATYNGSDLASNIDLMSKKYINSLYIRYKLYLEFRKIQRTLLKL